MDRKFDTKVQYLKYQVLREVVRLAYKDRLLEEASTIPKRIVPGKVPTMRCCVFKERAILQERVRMASGGTSANPNIIEVIDIACDECPVGGFEVTNACRGCIAHRCEQACRKGAITFDQHQKAHIDKNKCVECGMCAKVCPYNAIMNFRRPCEQACMIKAISMNEDKVALIDESKCVRCGACVYMCPFGAIVDKSYILNVIDILRKAEKDPEVHVYAVVAPSISGQFSYAKLGQVIAGIMKCGFFQVVEAALGADIITVHAEACTHLDRVIQQIKACGKKAAVSLNPATPLCALDYVLEELDMVLLMTVNPGFGGQKYISYCDDKIRALRAEIDRRGLPVKIQVDGGVKASNVKRLAECGVDVFVAGSAVFDGDITENVKKIMEQLQ